MRPEKELQDFLEKCNQVRGWGLSDGPCPLDEDNEEGCCAECSFPSAIKWVLGDENNPSFNMQRVMIDTLKNLPINKEN